ncbi:MAG: hypothetical protein ACXVCM_08340, partial [Ktedonobacteraceae bacterium]
MLVVRSVEAVFFPLDQELQVPDGHLLPHAQDTLVSMSSDLPFRRAVKQLEKTLGVVVHASTARRQTLAIGERMLEVQNAQAQPLATCPEEPASERMVMSSDGSMVPFVGGVWTQVKAVAIGTVERRRRKDEEQTVTTNLTYFARMAPAATFADQGSRGTAQAWHRESQRGVCDRGMEPSGSRGVCKAIGMMPCAFSTLRMQPATFMRVQTRYARVEGICQQSGWTGSCIDSNMRGQRGCCATS